MEKPKYWDEMLKHRHYEINYWSGAWVKNMFYDQHLCGSMRTDYIPEELKDRKWVPDDKKIYRCWWWRTNPSDPADPGEDILAYIEEVSVDSVKTMKKEIIKRISGKMNKMSLDQLKTLDEHIKKYY